MLPMWPSVGWCFSAQLYSEEVRMAVFFFGNHPLALGCGAVHDSTVLLLFYSSHEKVWKAHRSQVCKQIRLNRQGFDLALRHSDDGQHFICFLLDASLQMSPAVCGSFSLHDPAGV